MRNSLSCDRGLPLISSTINVNRMERSRMDTVELGEVRQMSPGSEKSENAQKTNDSQMGRSHDFDNLIGNLRTCSGRSCRRLAYVTKEGSGSPVHSLSPSARLSDSEPTTRQWSASLGGWMAPFYWIPCLLPCIVSHMSVGDVHLMRAIGGQHG